MKKSYKVLVTILLSIITYTLVTFLGTIIILLSKVELFNLQPKLFGKDIVYIHIQNGVFNANVTMTGVIIFGLLGGFIQILINRFNKRNK